MAIARQSLTHGTTTTLQSQTESVTVSAGSNLLLIVAVHAEVTGDQATAVTWNGVSLTKLGEAVPGAFGVVQFWYLKNPTPATANVVATYGGAIGAHRNLSALVFTGVDQTTTFRTLQSTTGSATSSGTLTVPSVVTNDYVMDFLTIDSTGHVGVPGANQTEEYDLGMVGSDRLHSSQAGADGGAMNYTWTTSAPFGYIATALIPASSGTTLSPASIDHRPATPQGAPVVSPSSLPASIDHGAGRALGAVIVSTSVLPSSIVHSRQFDAPTVSTSTAVVITAPSIDRAGDEFPPLVEGSRVLGTPTVGNVPLISPTSIDHGASRALGTILLQDTLSPAGIVHSRAFSTNTLNIVFIAPSIVHDRNLGDPIMTGVGTTPPGGGGGTVARRARLKRSGRM